MDKFIIELERKDIDFVKSNEGEISELFDKRASNILLKVLEVIEFEEDEILNRFATNELKEELRRREEKQREKNASLLKFYKEKKEEAEKAIERLKGAKDE